MDVTINTHKTGQVNKKYAKNLRPLLPHHTNARHGTTPRLPWQPHVTYQPKQQLVHQAMITTKQNSFPLRFFPWIHKILVQPTSCIFILKEGGRQNCMLMCVALVWKAWLSCHRCHSHWHCPRRAPLGSVRQTPPLFETSRNWEC